MRFIERKIMSLSIRSWCSIALLLGSYFIIHGSIGYLENKNNMLDYLIGVVLCVGSMVISAFPAER